MAKFFGKIGYVTSEETRPGIWEDVVEERTYSGELTRFTRHWQTGSTVNGNINISAQLSIIADSYLLKHMHCIRYVKLEGAAWEVRSIDPQRPRLLLELGGLYNGQILGGE